MKISKLFHWLYAFLMFLPIFAIAVKCGYVMFNENSKDSYRGSYSFVDSVGISNITISTTGSNALTSNLDISKGFYTLDSQYSITGIRYNGTRGLVLPVVLINYPDIVGIENTNYIFFSTSSLGKVIFLNNNFNYDSPEVTSSGFKFYPNQIIKTYDNHLDLDRYVVELQANQEYKYNNYTDTTFINLFKYDTFYVDTNLSSVFYSALQELDNVEFFSWAKNSFLAEPFMYIGNLFGIPNVHPIFTFLSYWLAISVIWLVFDVFMYVPLLAHKWIDKGKVD